MAQALIGSLRVSLGLDSAQFNKGVRDAGKSIQSMRVQFAAVAGAAAALGGVLATLTLSSARTATEISRLAQVANTTPEALQRWSAGAKTVGIEQEKLADILKDVNDRVGDFVTTGGGPMADFFEQIAPKIGITADAFRNLSGPDALQLFVSSLEKANLSQAEMTFYMEAMASDSTLLLPLLRANGTEMNRLAESSASLGAIMSDETVAALNKANIAVSEVSMAFRGMKNRIAGEVAPTLEMLAVAFTNSMREGGALRSVTDALIGNLDRITAYISVAVVAFGTRYVAALIAARLATMSLAGSMLFLRTAIIRTGFGALIVGAGELVVQFNRLSEKVGGFGEALGLLKAVAVEVLGRIVDGANYVGHSFEAMALSIRASFIQALGTMAAKFVEFTWTVADGLNNLFGTNLTGAGATITQELTSAWRDAQGAADAAASAAQASADAFGAPLTSLAALRAAASATATEVGGIADEAGRIAPAIDGGGEDGGGSAKDKLKEIADAAEKAKEAAKQAADQIKASFTDAFKGVITGATSLKEALANILGSIADMFLNSVGDFLFSGISSSLGSLVPIPAHASGTNYAPGGLSLVGERGPELVNLPRGSQVIPNHKLPSGGGGRSEIVLHAPEGFTAQQIGQIEGVSVRVVQTGLKQYSDNAFPRMQEKVRNDPRVRG